MLDESVDISQPRLSFFAIILNLLVLVLVLVFVAYTATCSAKNSYMIDFSTPDKYVKSLKDIRGNIGVPLTNIGGDQARIFMLPPQREGGMDGIIIAIRGVDFYNDEEVAPVNFVLDPTNLYISGFIVNNIYYRFSDTSGINAPGVIGTIQINQESSYTSLQRVANMQRSDMIINRATLTDGYSQLTRFSGGNINQETARALLRYITVIPEALRFRQIQRNFRPALDVAATQYVMSNPDISLTLNWGRLSSALQEFDERLASGIRIGSINLPTASDILLAIAVSLNCNNNFSKFSASYRGIAKCPINNSVIINKVIWNKETITTLLSE
ncbi:ribosome-inactivating family protein [Erwinia typographi]|uniref:ribosome-inactivating family protein n=1 Tax=Erwinia typographi TaxID=371042 RepID=UPI000690B821|nr:ribosome-inactivating family protein [Erwinia typographi]